MEQLTDPTSIQDLLHAIKVWAFDNVFVLSNLEQLAVISLAFIAARLVAPKLSARIKAQRAGRDPETWASKAADSMLPLALPIMWLALQWVAVLIASAAAWPHHIVIVVNSLLTAWVVIHLSSNVIRDPAWARLIAVTAWSIAALNIVGLLDDTIVLLDGIALNLGDLRVSALSLIKGNARAGLLPVARDIRLAADGNPHSRPAQPDAVDSGAVRQAAQGCPDHRGDPRRAAYGGHRPDRLRGAQRCHRRRHRLRPAESGFEPDQRRDSADRPLG